MHRSGKTGSHEPILLQTLRDQLQRQVFPVHRLDRPTAGLILFGLSGPAAAKMVDLFTRRMVSKYYQALVSGMTPDNGLVDVPLSSNVDSEQQQDQLVEDLKQDALTQYLTLKRFQILSSRENNEVDSFSLLEINPKTGRSHQIRRHLAHIGHPVIGDQRHGDAGCNQNIQAKTGVVRMLLTSMRLDFRHPYSGELQSILVGRGSSFDQVISQLSTQ